MAARTRVVVAALLLGASLPLTNGAHAADGDWPTYQQSADRAGAAAPGTSFSQGGAQLAWNSGPLDGAVYAEPLYVGGEVLVATESNTVYGMDAASGSVRWQTHLSDPVAASSLPCGNIRPAVGVTGTPVVDPSAGVLYVAAMTGRTSYQLYGVDVNSGAVVLQRPLDQPDLDAAAAGERGALGFEEGRVYVPFGGRYGDCGNYHGQVVAASTTDPSAPLLTYTTPARQAGIWAPGGVAIGKDGTVFVATGNGDASGPEGDTDAVVALSPDLAVVSTWQPADWQALDRADADVGSVPPALLQDLGLIFQSGKNGTGYLLNAGALGGVGAELASSSVAPGCGGVFGATAYAGGKLFVPCHNRVVALSVSGSPPAFSVAWSGPDETGQPSVGPPIVVGDTVWDLDPQGQLFALEAATGAVRYQTRIPVQPEHFAPLAYGGGQLYAAGANGVVAYRLAESGP
jgi:outer membrane protein assembly factor BamB